MKPSIMTQQRGTRDPKKISDESTLGSDQAGSDDAFDLWLQRGLHELFDDVTREPIPEELLRIIADDRQKG